MKLSEFLSDYFSNNALKRILNDMGLKEGGIKDELIKRIVREGDHDIWVLLQYLYIDDLKRICESNNLWISGKKDVLIDRIVENIKIDKPERKKKKEKVKERETLKPQLKNERKAKRKPQFYLLSAFIMIAIFQWTYSYTAFD